MEKIVILSDIISAAINTVCNHEYPSNFTNIICKINERIKDLCNKNVTLEILWVAGHAGIQGNDLADQCAKEAALQDEEIDFEDSQPLSFSEIEKRLNLTSSTFGKDSGIEMIKVNYCTKSNQPSPMIPSFRRQILLSTRE